MPPAVTPAAALMLLKAARRGGSCSRNRDCQGIRGSDGAKDPAPNTVVPPELVTLIAP
jgi:hypothetical protein